MTPTTTLLALILAVPISDIPHPSRYGGTVQVCDIVSPWHGPAWEDTRAEVWVQEQRDSVKYYASPGQLRRRRPCVPEPVTVLLLGGGWWWLWVNRNRVGR